MGHLSASPAGGDAASSGADLQSTVEEAEALAASLLTDALARRSRRERRQAARLARLLSAPAGRELVLALTDEVLRIGDSGRAAGVFARLAATGGTLVDDWRAARYLAPADRAALVAGARLAPRLPGVVMPLVRARVLREMAGVILPAGRRRLARHAAARRAQGIRLNVNVLGEAVLGEEEAERRLARIADVLSRPEVDYVSVKISSICSQLDVLAFDHEVDRIAGRLRRLYRAAGAKFVNLDMEEYRDLELTVAVFRKVLDEPEFLAANAGVVLQAYLPDSAAALGDLCGWARQRRARGGGWVKVRIVKGANLAMETVDAELHSWPRAPFEEKVEADANYKRMLETALDPGLGDAVRVGAASHNLFELAWAATRARELGSAGRLELEMLEGMSPAASRAVAARFGDLLLYAPIVERDDLESAIAYLVRRLDENSSPDNFITHQYAMTPGSPEWAEQAERFRRSVALSRLPAPTPRRDAPAKWSPEPFANVPDTDFTRAANRAWAALAVKERPGEYGPVVDGKPLSGRTVEATDPNRPDEASYRWASAGSEAIDEALAAAGRGAEGWRSTAPAERAAILRSVAAALRRERSRLVGVMAADAGRTVREADHEVSEAVDFAAYYAAHIPGVDAGFEPYGTVTVASPWNFPVSIPAGGVLAALAAGNAVILKPAPETVASAGEVARIMWEAGVPHSALHFVPCVDGPDSARLITGADAVVLTGSWETAQLFLSWRPDLDLHAETSGKNAIVVTATADPDEAIADLVASAFGHAGQKCSAASLAILEAPVFDDGRFLRRLADAVRSLRVGAADSLATVVGPLIRPPSGPLERALRRLDAGESWLVEPRRLGPQMWTPGVRVGVEAGSFFHLTECFGPVLGVMRARDLDHALELQNQVPFGLTAGLQALDPLEIDHWRARVEAGNLYVNRGITGAVVQRQPFGGWKRSVVGPGAKAGGPNYVASLGRWQPWRPGDGGDYRGEWVNLSRPSDPTGLRAESNVFRYRPLRSVAVVGSTGLEQAKQAAAAVGAAVTVLDRPVDAGSPAGSLAGRAPGGYDKLRLLDPTPSQLAEAHATGLWVDATPVAAEPRRELLRWVREQAVSESRHRHGNVTSRRPGLLPPPR